MLVFLAAQMAQKEADAGYELPAGLTKQDIYRIFGYNSPEEVEQFLQNCPRHYLRVRFLSEPLSKPSCAKPVCSTPWVASPTGMILTRRRATLPKSIWGQPAG